MLPAHDCAELDLEIHTGAPAHGEKAEFKLPEVCRKPSGLHCVRYAPHRHALIDVYFIDFVCVCHAVAKSVPEVSDPWGAMIGKGGCNV